MELDYYSLKSAVAKIGCIEEDLISLAAENKLSIYFKLGGRAILEMDRGCPDKWQEIAFYLWTQLKIHPLTFQRYQSNPSTLISELMNPDDPEEPGYCLKESVPLKDTTLFVSAEDVARLSQSGDYRGSKRDEPDYYPLDMVAEKTGYPENYLICLAADNKLPLYVKLGGKEAWALESHFEDGDSPEFCYLPTICKVWVSTIVEYQSDSSVLLFGLSPLDDPAINCYNLKDKIPLKDITLFAAADDVARLSRKENGSAASIETSEPANLKITQTGVVEIDVEGNESPEGRQSQLYSFIWRVHQFLSETKRPAAQKLWNEIQFRHKSHDTAGIIQEVDGRQILWCSGYGNEQRQLRSTFNKTLSKLRKSPPF